MVYFSVRFGLVPGFGLKTIGYIPVSGRSIFVLHCPTFFAFCLIAPKKKGVGRTTTAVRSPCGTLGYTKRSCSGHAGWLPFDVLR